MRDLGNGRVVKKERRLPVFRFDKAFAIARDVKVFLSLQGGVTRGAVPNILETITRNAALLRSRRLPVNIYLEAIFWNLGNLRTAQARRTSSLPIQHLNNE